MFAPMFHGQNRLGITPWSIPLEDPSNYIWISGEYGNGTADTYIYYFKNLVPSNPCRVDCGGYATNGDPIGFSRFSTLGYTAAQFDTLDLSYEIYEGIEIGNDDMYLESHPPYQFNFTGFLLFRHYQQINSLDAILASWQDVNNKYHFIAISNTHIKLMRRDDSTTYVTLASTTHGMSYNQYYLVSYTGNQVFINGTSVLSISQTNVGDWGMEIIGCSSVINGFNDYMPRFMEGIVYPRELTTKERQGIESWFNSKYSGIL